MNFKIDYQKVPSFKNLQSSLSVPVCAWVWDQGTPLKKMYSLSSESCQLSTASQLRGRPHNHWPHHGRDTCD